MQNEMHLGGGGESFLPKGFAPGNGDWGPLNSAIWKGKVQAIALQMGVGRRARSKVRV
jgi:hypothetical protein